MSEDQGHISPPDPLNIPRQGVIRGFGSTVTQRLRRYLLAGILFTAPISLTIYLTYLFLSFIDGIVSQILPEDLYKALYGGMTVPGIGFIIALVFFVVVGWMATNVLGRLITRLAEYIVNRVPVIRTLYGVMKQVLETLMTSQSSAFREVVMLEYPRKDVWTIGFVSGTPEGEIQNITPETIVSVFMPLAFNPTSGFLLFLPRKDLKPMDMSVEQALKLVVSGGILMQEAPKANKSESRKLINVKKRTRKTVVKDKGKQDV